MPEKLERKLKRRYPASRYGKERQARIVYGTLRKLGWRPRHARKRKRGKRAE